MTYLDTHAAVWLYAGAVDKLSEAAIREIESSSLLISPAVLLEIRLLEELGQITAGPEEILASLRRDIGLRLCSLAFDEVIRASYRHGWTRDPFDRMIVAHAQATSANLISKDRKIRAEYAATVW